jgi:hypothetical protein
LPSGKLADPTREAIIMPALTLDEQLTFDVAVALKKVKIPGFRKGVVEEGRFEIAKTIVEGGTSSASMECLRCVITA